MAETQELDHTTRPRTPAFLQARVLTGLGWTLLSFSVVLFVFHLLWMWRRMGSGAPMVAIGLAMEAVVGIGLIIAGKHARRKT